MHTPVALAILVNSIGYSMVTKLTITETNPLTMTDAG